MIHEEPRILVVSSEYPPGPGGIGTHAHQLVLQLRRLGWQPAVLTAQDYAGEGEREMFKRAQSFPVTTFRQPPAGLLKALDRGLTLRRWVRDWNPSLVMATGQRSTWIAAATLRSQRVPWVAVGHGTEFGVTGWQRSLVRRSFQRANAVVCVSEYTRRQMETCGIRPRQGCVIPNGADPSQFVPLPEPDVQRFRKENGWSGQQLLLTVGNVTERKGQEVVIRALPRILEREPSTQYLMAGLPTLRPQLAELARRLGVDRHVHFLGRVNSETLVRLLNACDIFIMTSRRTAWGDFEGYGIAVVEAALCGKPAVVSDGSGLSEAILDESTGKVVPENNPAATAEAVLSLLCSEPRRLAMGAAARSRALTEQTWEHRALQYDALFRDLTSANRPIHCSQPASRAS